jgi:hypothetical protein
MVHEFAHAIFCRLTGTPIKEVCYFRLGNPAGYVIHELPNSVWKHVLIGIGPLFVNSAAGFAIGLLGALHLWEGSLRGIGALVIWLAVSIAMHSFPSTTDAKSIWFALWSEQAPIMARVAGTPMVGLIYLGAIGSAFWLDLLYGLCIAIVLPEMLIG